MKQNNKQLKLHQLLTVKTDTGVATAKISRIMAMYNGTSNKGLTHTADVDSVHLDQLKNGVASVEVNGEDWITYSDIVPTQPSLIKFIYNKLRKLRFIF